MELSDLAKMPLRIEISRRAQWQQDEDNLRVVSAASIYRLPRGAEKPLLLLGPVGVPGNPDASWSELLRHIADALELDVEASPAEAVTT
jgi:hypothetical protein